LIELQVIITTIRVMKINHISISVSDQFAEQEINKLKIFFRKHCGKSGGLNVGFAELPANVGLIGIDTVFFTTALIGNALEQLNVHVLNLFQNVLTKFVDGDVVHWVVPLTTLVL